MNKLLIQLILILLFSHQLMAQFCVPSASEPWQEWIAQVELGTLNNSSGKCGSYGCGYDYFPDFTTAVTTNESINLTLTPGLSWSGHPADFHWRIWVDYNGNSDFSDADELVFEQSNGNQTIQSVINFVTTQTGVRRMRIAAKRGSFPDPCESFQFGEIEDYLIDLQDNSASCLNPNSSFDNGFDNWFNFGNTEYISSSGFNGCCSMQIGPDEGGFGMLNSIDANEGETFEVSTYGRIQGSPEEAAFGIKFLDGNYTPISEAQEEINSFTYDLYTVQATAPPGTQYAYAWAYKRGNSGFQYIDDLCLKQVDNPLPDLWMGIEEITTSPAPGESVNIDFWVNNGSDIPVSIWLSTDLFFDPANAIFLGSSNHGPFPANMVTNLNRTLQIPTSTPGGSYRLFAKVDGNEVIEETDENNNYGFEQILILGGTGPDLFVSSTDIESTVFRGRLFDLRGRVSNAGGQPAGGASKIFFYLSQDNQFSNDDILLGEEDTNNLPGGNLNTFDSFFEQVMIPPTISTGTYYILFVADAEFVINESNEINNVLARPITIPEDAPDVEIQTSIFSGFNVAPGETFRVRVLLQNQGNLLASGLKIRFYKPAGVEYVPGEEYIASQGSFDPDGSEEWDVDSEWFNLAYGSESLVLTFVRKTTASLTFYAELISMNEMDYDSSPNNGIPFFPREDDEDTSTRIPAYDCACEVPFAEVCGSNGITYPSACAAICAGITEYTEESCGSGNGPTVNLTTANNTLQNPFLVNIEFSAPVTQLEIEDFQISNAIASNLSGSGSNYTIFVSPINTGNVSISLPQDQAFDNDLNGNQTSNTLDIDYQPIGAGTADLSLEMSTFRYRVFPNNIAEVGIRITVSNNGPDFAEDVSVRVDNSPWVINIEDINAGESRNTVIFRTLSLEVGSVLDVFAQVASSSAPDPDSTPDNDVDRTPDEDDEDVYFRSVGPNNEVDLELSLSSDVISPPNYSTFSVTAQLTNDGDVDATGVVMSFPQPSGAVFVGGDEYSASQGTYSPHGDQLWDVGTVPAGAAVTIQFNLFRLQPEDIQTYAQVTDLQETDSDSTPDNGICCTANEDDEADLTILSVSGSQISGAPRENQSSSSPSISRLFQIKKVYPNPCTDFFNMTIQVKEVKKINYQIFDLMGKSIKKNVIQFESGINQIQMEVSDLKAGVYFILMENQYAHAPIRFVKTSL